MELFSQRKGLKPVKSVMQVDGMDDDLRNGLWNALTIYWDRVEPDALYRSYSNSLSLEKNKGMLVLVGELWHSYFKKPLDTLSMDWEVTRGTMRVYFFDCQWYEVYDFIEFIANNYPDKKVDSKFMDFCNSVLERELSAYRFVGGKIAQITSEEEVSEIEKALEISGPYKAVKTHLKRALDLLADRKSPDYRNSTKESISAVESICNLITKDKKATLGQALKKIEERGISLHPALESAFSNLYGYTSNAEGIRHALLDEPNLSFEDAKFMLVSCSAFVNYLITKASKAGIKM